TAALGKEKTMKNVPPKLGDMWRVNFFRLDMPSGRPQQGSSWSPPLVGDFHALDKFGELYFGDDKDEAPNVKAPAPEDTKKTAAAPENAQIGAKRRANNVLQSNVLKAAQEN